MDKRTILVWDLPTRLGHWLLVASFAGAFLTADSERQRNLHVLFGVTLVGLLISLGFEVHEKVIVSDDLTEIKETLH